MKKWLTLFISLLYYWIPSQAQRGGWETGLGLTLGSCAQLKSNDGFKTSDNPTILQFSTGVLARKFFKENYGFEFGAQISYFGLKRYKSPYTVYPNGTSGYPTYMSKRDYLFAELPLRFAYKYSIKKFDLGAFAGLSPAVLILASEMKSNNSGLTDTMSYSSNIYPRSTPMNLFADLGILFRVNVYNRLYFEAKPIARISLFNLDKASGANSYVEKFLTAGTILGITWRL